MTSLDPEGGTEDSRFKSTTKNVDGEEETEREEGREGEGGGVRRQK